MPVTGFLSSSAGSLKLSVTLHPERNPMRAVRGYCRVFNSPCFAFGTGDFHIGWLNWIRPPMGSIDGNRHFRRFDQHLRLLACYEREIINPLLAFETAMITRSAIFLCLCRCRALTHIGKGALTNTTSLFFHRSFTFNHSPFILRTAVHALFYIIF